VSTAVKLTGFGAVLAALFAVGLLAGGAVDPDSPVADAGAGAHDAEAMSTAGEAEHGAAMPVRGLAAVENGVRIIVDDPELEQGRAEEIAFRIVGESGEPVREFEVEHTKRMHLIVARRDLTGFQHLHPEMRADGTWTTSITLPQAGSYRLYADFVREGEPITLAGDLRVDGDAELAPLPAPASTDATDGYDVELASGAAEAGAESELSFEVSRDGEPVRVEPYLGADGHLVILREGDLAFLHVHPSEHEDAEAGEDAVNFEATLPTAGRYRMFLQFRHQGRVHTAEFTEEVSSDGG
jgi:hypothetical protein